MRIIGKSIDREVTDEIEHFYTCPGCGQSVDMRDLAEVLRHEEPGHKPTPVE